jgi:hypothetical protein
MTVEELETENKELRSQLQSHKKDLDVLVPMVGFIYKMLLNPPAVKSERRVNDEIFQHIQSRLLLLNKWTKDRVVKK